MWVSGGEGREWSREKRRRRRWERWKELGLVWFVFFFHHSSLITLNTTPIWHHYSIFFTLFVGPILVTRCIFFFPVPKLIEPSEKKKKKPQNRSNQWKKEEEEKKKKRIEQPTRRRKEKKSQKWSKVMAGYCLWVPYVCLITILPSSYELWKLKIAKMCFSFP